MTKRSTPARKHARAQVMTPSRSTCVAVPPLCDCEAAKMTAFAPVNSFASSATDAVATFAALARTRESTAPPSYEPERVQATISFASVFERKYSTQRLPVFPFAPITTTFSSVSDDDACTTTFLARGVAVARARARDDLEHDAPPRRTTREESEEADVVDMTR